MKRLARAIYTSLPFKRQVYSFIRHRLGIVPGFYQHLHFKGPFDLAIDAEHKIRLVSAGNVVENELFWHGFGGTWEATSLRLWKRICERSSGTILDVGANSGVYALVAAKLAPSAQVIAFEPIARVADQLRHNVELNGLPIRVEERAVSDRDGSVAIYDVPVAYNYSASIEGQGPSARRTEVPVCSIDKLLPGKGALPVTAIKIDVERHEAAAIAGMKRTLARDRPAILIEILDEMIGSAVAGHIAGLGYLMFQIAEGRGIIPADRLTPLAGHDWNHLLCSPEQFESLELADFLAR